MNTPNINIEARWRTYFKAAVSLTPPVAVLAFACVFLLPKLEAIWRDAGFSAAFARGVLRSAYFVTHNALTLGAGILAMLVLLEWRSERWPRYRKSSMGVAAFLANTTVLFFMTVMLITALLAAPALR